MQTSEFHPTKLRLPFMKAQTLHPNPESCKQPLQEILLRTPCPVTIFTKPIKEPYNRL